MRATSAKKISLNVKLGRTVTNSLSVKKINSNFTSNQKASRVIISQPETG